MSLDYSWLGAAMSICLMRMLINWFSLVALSLANLITGQSPQAGELKVCGGKDSFPSPIVQLLSHVSLQPHGLQHARLPCPSPSPRTCLNSCPLSW